MLGIGNVCVDKENTHAGVGSILMACINSCIKELNTCGILLCKERLIKFYESSNWIKACPGRVFVSDQLFTNNVMIYDPIGTVISSRIDLIEIQRNF